MPNAEETPNAENIPVDDPELEVAIWIDEQLSPHPPQVTFSQ